MKNSTRLVTIITSTAIAGLLAFGNVAQAESGSGKGGKAKYSQMTDAEREAKMLEKVNRLAEKLGLSEAQKIQMISLKQSSKTQNSPLRQEMRALSKELKTLDPQSNDYAVKQARQGDLKNQLKAAKENERQQLAVILTPEQLAAMEEMKSNRKGGKKGGKRNKENT